MLLSEGKCISKTVYCYCDNCSDKNDPSDIKHHYYYERKRYCKVCNTASFHPHLSFTRGEHNLENTTFEPILAW